MSKQNLVFPVCSELTVFTQYTWREWNVETLLSLRENYTSLQTLVFSWLGLGDVSTGLTWSAIIRWERLTGTHRGHPNTILLSVVSSNFSCFSRPTERPNDAKQRNYRNQVGMQRGIIRGENIFFLGAFAGSLPAKFPAPVVSLSRFPRSHLNNVKPALILSNPNKLHQQSHFDVSGSG